MTLKLPSQEHRFVSLDEMRELAGCETGVSDWFAIEQEQVDAFAALCGDHQFIHVNPERARQSAVGGTIAHGFYVLSLLTWLGAGPRPRLSGLSHSVNYGFDRIRFVAPVPVGSRIRARFALARLDEERPHEVTLHWDVTVEIERGSRPALVARWLSRAFVEVA